MNKNLFDSNTKKSNIKTVEQISAGGVAFRQTDSIIEIALIAVNPSGRWQLPKGIIDLGETSETAALREVREEAGIETDLLAPIETIEYWYFGDKNGERVRFHKLVHFYLLAYRRGSVGDHDHEVDEARWVKLSEALKMLAFQGEKSVVEKASKLIPQFLEK
jgi:8-oxo-dGTP pyrophosphatase MutT (NUDIX family)